jgi:sn-glycerol 3-phosphate transport system permease protein
VIGVSLLVPIEVTLVANVETVQRLGGIDSYWALVVPFLAFPLGTFLLRQAFLGVPGDLRDAAALDGYGHLAFLVRVGVPLVRPTVAALALFSFLLAWNQYLWPLMVTNDDDRRTVQIGLTQLSGGVGPDLGLIMTATLLAAVPILILLLLFERQIVAGLTSGAVKG